jgi:hypothetical protein
VGEAELAAILEAMSNRVRNGVAQPVGVAAHAAVNNPGGRVTAVAKGGVKPTKTILPALDLFPRSEIKKALCIALAALGSNAKAKDICAWLDGNTWLIKLPGEWSDGKNRSFSIAYAHDYYGGKIDRKVTEVRTELKDAGYVFASPDV